MTKAKERKVHFLLSKSLRSHQTELKANVPLIPEIQEPQEQTRWRPADLVSGCAGITDTNQQRRRIEEEEFPQGIRHFRKDLTSDGRTVDVGSDIRH